MPGCRLRDCGVNLFCCKGFASVVAYGCEVCAPEFGVGICTQILVNFGCSRPGCLHRGPVRRWHGFPTTFGGTPVNKPGPSRGKPCRRPSNGCWRRDIVDVYLAPVFIRCRYDGRCGALAVKTGREGKGGRDYGDSHQGMFQALAHNREISLTAETQFTPAYCYPEPDGEI